MKRLLELYAPTIVLAVWALAATVGIHLGAFGLAVLAIAMAFNVHATIAGWRQHGK